MTTGLLSANIISKMKLGFSIWCFLFLIMQSCNTNEAKQNIAKNEKGDTLLFTQEGSNVTITYTDSGHLKAKIFAPTFVGYKKENSEIIKMPNGIQANFYNQWGAIESTLSAEKGISYQTKKITEVWQNVVVTNYKGEKLNTEKLIWNQNTQKIYTDKFVKITTANEIITGEGMDAKQDFTQWHILKPKGIINIKKDSLK